MGESFSTAVFGLWGHWGLRIPAIWLCPLHSLWRKMGALPSILENPEPQTFLCAFTLTISFPRGIRKAETWLDTKRNLGKALLHLPQSLIGNAILSFFSVSGGEASFDDSKT